MPAARGAVEAGRDRGWRWGHRIVDGRGGELRDGCRQVRHDVCAVRFRRQNDDPDEDGRTLKVHPLVHGVRTSDRVRASPWWRGRPRSTFASALLTIIAEHPATAAEGLVVVTGHGFGHGRGHGAVGRLRLLAPGAGLLRENLGAVYSNTFSATVSSATEITVRLTGGGGVPRRIT